MDQSLDHAPSARAWWRGVPVAGRVERQPYLYTARPMGGRNPGSGFMHLIDFASARWGFSLAQLATFVPNCVCCCAHWVSYYIVSAAGSIVPQLSWMVQDGRDACARLVDAEDNLKTIA